MLFRMVMSRGDTGALIDGVTSVSPIVNDSTVRAPVNDAGPVRGRNDDVDSELSACSKVEMDVCSSSPLTRT